MAQAKKDIKQTIEEAKTIKIGYYSATAEKNGGTIYVYATPDGKGTLHVISVASCGPPNFDDVISLGPVGKFLYNIKGCRAISKISHYLDSPRKHSTAKTKQNSKNIVYD